MPETTEVSAGKLKYDILRNSLRTMIAEGRFDDPSVKIEVKALLEVVRVDDVAVLKVLSQTAKAKRKVVRAITTSNGEPIREEEAA